MSEITTGEPVETCDAGISRSRPGALRWQVVALGLGCAGLAALGYVAYQRAGTDANVSLIEYNKNLSGGFLAVACSQDQPGFLVLSAMDRRHVDVHAEQSSNWLAGTYTSASVDTPSDQWHSRLRGPQAIIIDESGSIEHTALDISIDEVNHIREAVDCSHVHPGEKHQCGQPFVDLHKALSRWPVDKVPVQVIKFLALHGRAS